MKIMAAGGNREQNRIQVSWQTLRKNQRGSAIVMVLVAVAFVGIMASMLMYVSLINYRIKATDRKAKDNFYSAELAVDEIRAGLLGIVYDSFSRAYEETLQNYAQDDGTSKNELFKNKYEEYLIDSIKMQADSGKYDLELLRQFVTELAADKDGVGAYIDSRDCEILKNEDGIRLKKIKVTYTDAAGYVSMIETDILLVVPNLGIHTTYEFPDVEEYCVIADEKIQIGNGSAADNGVIAKGSVYGGKKGIELDSRSAFYLQGYQPMGEIAPKPAKVITDGEISMGNELSYNSSHLSTAPEVSLWTAGIRIDGIASTMNADADNYVLSLRGNTYVQDDLTIGSSGTGVLLEGSYIGFGNANTKAEKSSSIIINGADTTLNLVNLADLSLGGNTYIATSKLNLSVSGNQISEAENKDIKMGNAIASKAEQLAYLVPAECIGYDLAMNRTMVGRNPVNVKDELYLKFLDLSKTYPDDYKEVNLSLIDKIVGKPLANYGATYEKVYYKPDRDTIWAYYYLKFTSSLEAARFFKDYYTANPASLNNYIEDYIHILDTGNLEHLNLNIVGNMVARDSAGNFKLIEATVGQDLEEQIRLNKEYAKYSNQFVSLCKKLTTNYEDLTAKERKSGVYDNIINTELIQRCKTLNIFLQNYVVFENASADALALLILNDGNDGTINLYQAFEEAGIAPADWRKVHLVVSERNLEVKPYAGMTDILFEGTVIIDGVLSVPENRANFSVMESLDDVLLATYSYEYDNKELTMKALSLFREGKDSEITGVADIKEENHITSEELVVYENWTKQ